MMRSNALTMRSVAVSPPMVAGAATAPIGIAGCPARRRPAACAAPLGRVDLALGAVVVRHATGSHGRRGRRRGARVWITRRRLDHGATAGRTILLGQVVLAP